MSILKTINRIIAGPLLVPQNYGDYLWIGAFIALHVNPTFNIVYLALGTASLYPFLMYYTLATVTLVRNAVIENPSEELQNEVNLIAQQEEVSIATLKKVSNFSAPSIICGRFPSNAELFISTHFLEDSNTAMRRMYLHQSFKLLHATTKMIIINTAIAAFLITSILLTTKLSIIYFASNSILKWACILLANQTFISTSRFLKAYINRKLIYKIDLRNAKILGTQTVIDALSSFNAQTNFDNNVHEIPEWALAIPKISSRIAVLQSANTTS